MKGLLNKVGAILVIARIVGEHKVRPYNLEYFLISLSKVFKTRDSEFI
jgi:hypothetical protein